MVLGGDDGYEITISGGSFSSIGVGYETNESCAVTIPSGARVESGEGFYLGYRGSGSTLDIQPNATLWVDNTYVGYESPASSNRVVVSGEGALLHNRNGLYLGGHFNGTNWINGGTGNALTVLDGGWVQVGYIGTNNFPKVGTLGGISVGGLGGAEMVVANGSRVVSDVGYIGLDADMSGSVTVKGSGSVWENSGVFHVGYNGSGNTLRIEEGAEVINYGGTIGHGTSASGNRVMVSGQDSLWDNTQYSPGAYPFPTLPLIPYSSSMYDDPITGSGHLSVGYQGSSNLLSITDGARVVSTKGFIGHDESAVGNRVVVSGEGSVWSGKSGFSFPYYPVPVKPLPIDPIITPWLKSTSEEDSSVIQQEAVAITSVSGVIISSGSISVIGTPPAGAIVPVTPGLPVYGGGGIIIGDPIIISPSNSVPILLPAPGMEELHVGHNGSDNSLLISDGGRVESSASYIGYGESANGNSAVVSGAGSVWNHSNLMHIIYGGLVGVPVPRENFLSVGYAGSGNSLLIEDGGLVMNRWGSVGETSNAWNNAVSVVGAGSEWRNLENLYLGGSVSLVQPLLIGGLYGWVDGGQGNSLTVADGGLVSVGNHLVNRNYSTVTLDDPDSRVVVGGNYYQDATSALRFGMALDASGTPTNALMSVGGTAEFEAGTSLQYHYDGTVGWMDFDTVFTNRLVVAERLRVGGVTNASSLDLEVIKLDGSLVDLLLWEKDQDIYGLIGRKYLADSAGFASGSMMAGVSREIDDLSLMGNPLAVEQINLLNGMSPEQQAAQLTQRYAQGTPTYRHRQSLLGGQKQVLAQSRAFQSGNRSKGAAPTGAAGPHTAEQGLRGWMRGYGSWADHDGSSSFSGFDQNVYGTVVGLDRVFGHVLLGAAGGYSRSDLTQDNHDSSDAKTGFGVLYSSFGSADWFGDLNVSYGRSGIQTHSGTALGGEGDFDADNYAVYLGGGKEIRVSGNGLLFTPEAALNVGYYDQEGYADGLMDIDAYDCWSVQSRFGAALAFETMAKSIVWKPELRAYWLHEFNADPDQIGYTLGTGRYAFGVQSPDEDILEAGAGLRATINDRLELGLDIDGQYSERYSALIVGARAAFKF